MGKNNDPLKNAFDVLKEIDRPTEQQKDKMLNYILAESRQETSLRGKIIDFITVYP